MPENTKKCSACGDIARYAYTANFRIGGISAGWKLLLGEWAEVGEEMIPSQSMFARIAEKSKCAETKI